MPDFTVKPNKKKTKLPRYELLGSNERISFSVRHDTSFRAKFHNTPVFICLKENKQIYICTYNMTRLNEAQLLVTVLGHSPLSVMRIAAYQVGDLKTNYIKFYL